MKKTFFNIQSAWKHWGCLLIFMLFSIGTWGQEGGEKAVEELVNQGFENVRWTENESERIYTVENNVYKAQGVGIAKAIDIIQTYGMPTDKSCKVIVTHLGIPELSLTYRPKANKVENDGRREGWQASYDIGNSWKEVKEKKTKNSSRFKVDIVIYPQLYFKNYIITQIYQACLEMSPAVEVSLWQGMKLTGQIIFPVYNDGYYGSMETIRPGYLTLEQRFRLPYRIKAKATVGVFDFYTYGAELSLFYPFKDERFSLEGKFGYVGYGYFHGFSFIYNKEYTDYFSIGGNFYWPQYNTEFKLKVEQYLLKEKGIKFEMIRHFRYASVGFYAEKAEYAKSNGGFKFIVALPPYKQKRHKYLPRLTTSAGTGITYNAGNERIYYKMPYSSATENNIMFKNSFNPYFIKSEISNY